MPAQQTFPSIGKVIKRGVLAWALPHLEKLPEAEWRDAIQRACDIDFDKVERIAIVAGVAFVALAMRFDTEQATTLSLPVRLLVQFIGAVPLLMLVVGPFFLRRARRGLDRLIADRSAAISNGVRHECDIK